MGTSINNFGTAVTDVKEPITNNDAKVELADGIRDAELAAEGADPEPDRVLTPVSAKKLGGLGKINKGKVKKPRRIILYGVDGIGKSTLASHAPKAIFVPTEDGLGNIDCESFPHAHSWREVKSHLTTLCNEKHKYKTVVVDSLDWLERLIWTEVCDDRGVSSIDEIGYGKGYGAAIQIWEDLLKALNYLRNNRGMGVILIAHAKVVKFENPEGENYDQYALALHKLAAPILREWADEVLFASYKVYTTTKEGDFGKEETKAIGGDERILRTREKPFCYAKNRMDLPDEIPMTWKDYVSRMPK